MTDSIAQGSTSGTGNESEKRKALREQLLGEDASRALAFQTVAVKHFGADGGIFIRQLLYRDGSGKEDDFWIYKSMAEWEQETGLQRRGQERARKRLIGAGVMEEKKAIIHGRRTLHFRVEPWKLMEVLGDELPHAKPLTSDLDCTLNRTGSMSVNRTGSMSGADRDHADSRQGITEDYSEDHSEEVSSSPFSPTASCSCEKILRRIEGFPPNATDAVDKLVKEWPEVDAEEVCKRFELWHLENPGRTNGILAQLETFFVNESIDQFFRESKEIDHFLYNRKKERDAAPAMSSPAQPDPEQEPQAPRDGVEDLSSVGATSLEAEYAARRFPIDAEVEKRVGKYDGEKGYFNRYRKALAEVEKEYAGRVPGARVEATDAGSQPAAPHPDHRQTAQAVLEAVEIKEF